MTSKPEPLARPNPPPAVATVEADSDRDDDSDVTQGSGASPPAACVPVTPTRPAQALVQDHSPPSSPGIDACVPPTKAVAARAPTLVARPGARRVMVGAGEADYARRLLETIRAAAAAKTTATKTTATKTAATKTAATT